MISLHKWYPFVHPKNYDIQTAAIEARIEKAEFDYKQLIKAQKVREAVEAFDLELYNKRARQTTVELQIFTNQKHFDKFA